MCSNCDSAKEVVIFSVENTTGIICQFIFPQLEIQVKMFIYVSSVQTRHTIKNTGCQWQNRHSFFISQKSPHHRRGHRLTVVIESEMRFRLLCYILRIDINGLSLSC